VSGVLLHAVVSALTSPGTGGLCFTASAAVGLAIGGSVCLQEDSTGEVGLTISPSIGLGGIGASASLDATVSNADKLDQLSGWGSYVDIAVGELSYFHTGFGCSGTLNSQGEPIVSTQFGVGVGVSLFPAIVSGGVSDTFVIPLGNASQ
jgi:hypothetical protein